MSNPITGLVQVTGDHDTGKSTFCLTSGYSLSKTAFIDDDEKGRATVEQIGVNNFGLYLDLVELCSGKKEIEQHLVVLDIIKRIEDKDIDVVVWDTWTRAGKSCYSYVKKFPTQFKEKYSAMGEIKGAEEAAASNTYEADLFGRLSRKAKLVFVTAHLRDQRKNLSGSKSVLTGKSEPDARKMVEEKANFRVWARHNPSGIPIPVGLILKRPIKWSVDKDGVPSPINYLPRKINPLTWEHILWYYNNPVGDRVPTPEEMPDEFELSILDGTLTADQKMTYRASVKAVESEPFVPDVIDIPVDENIAKVKELSSQGMTKPLIAKELSLTIPQVIQYLSNGSKTQ